MDPAPNAPADTASSPSEPRPGAQHAAPSGLAGRPLDHVGIAVADLDAASAPYFALGLAPLADEIVAGQGVRVRAFSAGGPLVELLAPTGAGGPIARFLERRGPGLHHIAFRSSDLDADVAALQADGAQFIDPTPSPGRAGTRAVFLHPAWGHGVLIEVVEHA